MSLTKQIKEFAWDVFNKQISSNHIILFHYSSRELLDEYKTNFNLYNQETYIIET